jgi:hypothetical protein
MRLLGSLSLALICAGCTQRNVYSGTGVMVTSGAPTLVAEHTLTIASCPQPAAHMHPTPPRSLMALGDECVMEGTIVTGGFRARPATCTLHFEEGPRTIQVSNVSVTFPRSRYDHGVTLTGRDAATGQQVLYQLTITRIANDDARAQLLCARTLRQAAATGIGSVAVPDRIGSGE